MMESKTDRQYQEQAKSFVGSKARKEGRKEEERDVVEGDARGRRKMTRKMSIDNIDAKSRDGRSEFGGDKR